MVSGGRVKVASKIRSQSHSNRMLMLMYDNTIFIHEENGSFAEFGFPKKTQHLLPPFEPRCVPSSKGNGAGFSIVYQSFYSLIHHIHVMSLGVFSIGCGNMNSKW